MTGSKVNGCVVTDRKKRRRGHSSSSKRRLQQRQLSSRLAISSSRSVIDQSAQLRWPFICFSLSFQFYEMF